MAGDLERLGWTVRTFQTPLELAHECTESPPQVVLLGLDAGVSEALQLLDTLRSLPQSPEVVLFGALEAPLADIADARGALMWVPSAADLAAAAARIETWLALKHKAASLALTVAALEQRQVFDPSSGAHTALVFEARLNQEFERAKRFAHPLGLVAFRPTLTSHPPVKQFFDVVMSGLRSFDVIGTVGGQTFCALLPYTTLFGAQLVADRIALRAKNLWPCSFGVVAVPDADCISASQLLAKAVVRTRPVPDSK